MHKFNPENHYHLRIIFIFCKSYKIKSGAVRTFYTTHHHQPPDKTYLPPHTTTQKMYRHSVKVKIYSHIASFWHSFNSFFFNKMQYSFPWRRFFVMKFWSVCFSNSKFQQHFADLRFFKFIFKEKDLLLFAFINKVVILSYY